MKFLMKIMAEDVELEEWEDVEVEADDEDEAYEKAQEKWARRHLNILTKEAYDETFEEYEIIFKK